MATANMGLSFLGCPFQAPDQKWQARFFCYMASLARSLAHSSASPFLFLHDMALALFTREAVRRLHKMSVCGKMLPDNQGVCGSEGKLRWPWIKRELAEIHHQSCYCLLLQIRGVIKSLLGEVKLHPCFKCRRTARSEAFLCMFSDSNGRVYEF